MYNIYNILRLHSKISSWDLFQEIIEYIFREIHMSEFRQNIVKLAVQNQSEMKSTGPSIYFVPLNSIVHLHHFWAVVIAFATELQDRFVVVKVSKSSFI